MRVTPILGIIAVVLIYFTKEPERGEHEGHTGSTSYKEDLKGKDRTHTKIRARTNRYRPYSVKSIDLIFSLLFSAQIFHGIDRLCYQPWVSRALHL